MSEWERNDGQRGGESTIRGYENGVLIGSTGRGAGAVLFTWSVHDETRLWDPCLDGQAPTEADAQAAVAEGKEIVAVCAAAKLPEMAAGLIKARVPLASVRNRLMQARAELDKALVTDHHIPQPTTTPQSAISIAGIYAARRKSA